MKESLNNNRVTPPRLEPGQRRIQYDRDHPGLRTIAIEGLTALKIAKQCDEDPESQGVLLGMVTNDYIEVTNCFPFPRHSEDEEADDSDYQIKMMRHLRNANVDHLTVGWYQSNPNGTNSFKFDTVDSQHLYQNLFAQSIIVFYDPIRAQRGYMGFRAYHLRTKVLRLFKEGSFTVDMLNKQKFTFTEIWQQMPVRIANSTLVSGMMCEMDSIVEPDIGKQLWDLRSFVGIEKTLQNMMKSLDKVVMNQRYIVLKRQQIQRENFARIGKGEPVLTEEECAKILRTQTPQQRIESWLHFSQTHGYCRLANSYASQNFTKLAFNFALESSQEVEED